MFGLFAFLALLAYWIVSSAAENTRRREQREELARALDRIRELEDRLHEQRRRHERELERVIVSKYTPADEEAMERIIASCYAAYELLDLVYEKHGDALPPEVREQLHEERISRA